ncbi:putative rac serine-threonine kinase [Leptomonas pyrrhocoris]|uniref:non-specific serine/threonine protein kinase n=1 Tax=Leptomonas pyrrhocoris TaxID=157538 RepID=A0A0N0DS27_LEPPY|nr:putative rac serine-threonine kinase [Leptomonas pyrrhocoris]KPA75298.1 putative rac serine-threonine kinase [Leptomonas pyrrhocoris]|eukprot:XP_015653737.1 putative rac serine-threonine kinase [Leptomonas pyrrhocoris]
MAFAQQIQLCLKALTLDWEIVDREIDLITVRVAAVLLTSRLRVEKGSARDTEGRDDPTIGGHPVKAHSVLAECAGEAATGSGATAAATDHDDVGPQELYVSAALRLAALQLGRCGLQRIIVALAFLANGGESCEERRLRRNTSLSTNNPDRRAASSSQEINHFQRRAGYTGSATAAAGAASSGTLYNAAGTALNVSGSMPHSLASSGSALAGRRFSTAPHAPAPSTNTYMVNNNCNYYGGPNQGAGTGNAAYVSGTSIDQLAYSTSGRGGGSNSTSVGQGYAHMVCLPYSARGREETEYPLGASSLSHRQRSVSPLSATSGPGSHLLCARHPAEVEFAPEERSYNNTLLTSMNARSTVLSPRRTGLHGELLYSNSSFGTLLSLSTGAAAHTTRSHRGGGTGERSHSNSAIRSPVSPSLVPATQWVIPPAPAGGLGTSTGGSMSAASSVSTSLFSMASPPNALDPRRRPESYSRRVAQPSSPFPINRLPPVGTAGIGVLSRPVSIEGNMNTLTYQLPHAVGGGFSLELGAGNSCYSSSDYEATMGHAPLSHSLHDTALQFLRPEAVLTALCSTFAHLHLSTDDVTNFVTLLVVAALEVQTDAQLRRMVEAGEEVTPESLHTPSMKQVRTAVKDSLTVLLTPMYTKTRLLLCAAAGMVERGAATPLPSSGGLESGGAAQHQQHQRQYTPKPGGTSTADSNAGSVSLPSAFTQSGERNFSIPAPPFPGSPLRSIAATTTADDDDSTATTNADLAAHVRGLHGFFESTAPIESASGALSASAAAATVRAAAAPRLSATQRSSDGRQQLQQQQVSVKAAAVAAAPYAHSSYSESAAGPTSCGSILSRSDTNDAVGNTPNPFPGRPEASFAAPSQEEVRCASSFLMDVEAAFVLHYAEIIEDVAAGKRKSSTASSMPSTPSSPTQRLRQRTSSITKRPQPLTPSAAAASSSAASSSTAKAYPWKRRGDADPDMFVQLGSNTTVWPLRTRLLVRRHEYVYVYDAMASTMALLREENLYTSEGAPDAAEAERALASRVPHPHTPIALMDLNKATVEKNANDLQVLSGPGDVEVVSLMPSRVSRSSLVNPNERRASTNPTATSSVKNGGSSSGGGSARSPSCFDDLLNRCWTDAYEQDMEVYRMKGSTGTMYLLTVPAESDRVMVSIAATSPSRPAKEDGAASSSTMAAGAPTEEVIRTSVIRSFERNRLVRPAVLSLASSATTAAGGGGKEGEDVSRAALGKSPRIQCAYNDGNREVLSLELGSEPIRIAAYPLRLIYKGVLHHFFFPNPSARDHWYQQLLQISWMTQSRRYMETVAAAPHNVERFIRNRISFPTGPGAFECLDMLGAGTFGRVLLVQHKLSKRLFAMKVIRKSGFHGVRNVIEARREKKILDQLDCPYIMKIHSSFQTDSRVYLLFDYLPGAELLLHTQSAHSFHFDETTSRFYIAELAIAVEYLRVRGIVHRDIKGDNLVLDAEGHIVLTDFGFAKNITSTSAADPYAPPQVIRQHTSCGTLAYIAPEVLCNSRRRSGYDLAVDWWSLGVVLFTFMTGFFPFLKPTGPETSQAIVSSPLQLPPRPTLSSEARSLLSELLQKSPEKRITCLADLRHHRFFEGFDWTACQERRLPPPLVLHKDSYRSPRTTADARQLLQDRVHRSLAWSAGQTDVPYVAPSHSRRPASDKLSIQHQPQLTEEQAELKLLEQAYGPDCMPKPLSSCNDVFGPFFDQQEICGSDREESDLEDLNMEDYVADLSNPALEALKRLRENGVSQELCASPSDISFNSVYQEYVYAGEDREAVAAGLSRPGKMVPLPAPPTMIHFNEELYCDVALAKYNPAVK